MSKERVLSAVALVVIALAAILPGGVILAAVLYLVSIVGFLELTKACGVREKGAGKANALEKTGILVITGYYLLLCVTHTDIFVDSIDGDFGIVPVLLLALILMMSVYVFTFPRFTADQVMAAYFSLIYAPVMLSFVFLTRQLPHGIYLVWMAFINSWVSDTCAYLVGVMIGKHKLAPVLSPKKSIEGAVGGIVGAALVGALFGRYLDGALGLNGMAAALAVVGGAGSVISQVGDLAASAIKRNHDIKDYGKLIPGHGGIMDRFDSVIFTAPITYFLILLFIK
ncbi:MAG: phosphatidate cytidylyltransferase [Roseburia sp.]|nr:phosphatidate cytidylyltransferase [Roseburia sp.]